MSYPSGVSLAVITAGTVSDFFGGDSVLSATATPVLKGTPYLVHAATGSVLVPTPVSFSAGKGESLAISVPHTDQDGWLDAAGNPFKGWAYDIKVTAGKGYTWSKTVSPVIGQDLIDLDLVKSSGVGTPIIGEVPTVISVVGKTGAITAQDLIDAGIVGVSDWADISGKPEVFPTTAPTWGEVTGKPETFPTTPPAWDQVTGKPATFPASWETLTGKPATFPSTPTGWGEVTGKPSVFPPAAHAHAWADVTGKPAAFPPATHAHAITDVTGLRAELDSKGGDAFTPEKYGAKGDGTTDDAQAIRDATAAAAGAPVVFTSGKTYLIGSALAFTGVDVNWVSSGVKPAVLFHNGQDFVPLSINGTRNVTTTTLTASHAINTYRWQVASSSGVQPGMLVGIVSSKLWYHDNRGATYKSELHRVTKVGAGWIETEDPANDGYDKAVETVTLTFHKPSLTRIENLTLRKVLPPPSDTAKGQDGIRLTGLDSPKLLDVNVENSATSAISLTECWRPLVDGGYSYSSNDYGTGYGTNTAGTAHAVVRNRKFWECRRGVDFSGAPIISRHSLVENCVHMGGGANSRGTTYGWDETTGYTTTGGFLYGFGTHGGADHTTYRNNTTIANSYAYSCRGRDEKIIGNTMIGRTYRGSIVLSTGAGALIEGNTVIGGWRGGGKESQFWQTGATEGSRTSDFLVYVTKDYEGAADSDVIIRDNNVEVQYNLIQFEAGGTAKHLTVQGNRIRFYPHVANDPCAVVASLDTTPITVTDWTVAANDYRRMSGTGTTELVRGVNVGGAVIRDMMVPAPAPTAYQPVNLTGTTHLDTVKTPGDYLTPYAIWSKPENGYPAEAYGNGRVEVRSLGGQTLEQRWTPYGRLGVWKRCYNGSTWAVAWHKIETVA